jgi:hypothetical protein
MAILSAQPRFLIGITSIILSRLIPAFVSLLHQDGFSWFFPIVGALLFLTLGYCAWRGERWAYYFLMFLNIIDCILAFLVIFSPPELASFILTVLMFGLAIFGGVWLSISESTHTFMDAQRRLFISETRSYQ